MKEIVVITRNITLVAVLLMAAGCTKLEDEPEASGGRAPVTPPGIAPVGGLDLGQPNAATPSQAPAGQTPAAPPSGGSRQGIIGKTTAQVVDLHAAMAQNPNLKIVEQRAQGGDPITFALDAYVDVRSRVSTLGMQRDIQAYKALNDRFPTYAEFMDTMRQHGIQFSMIEPYRMYGYDEKTGAIVVLEDPDDKRRRYEAAGLSVDE
jgi:hypothetical protein